jgi:hypothetical protein
LFFLPLLLRRLFFVYMPYAFNDISITDKKKGLSACN